MKYDIYIAAIDEAISRIREIDEDFKRMIETNNQLLQVLNRPERLTKACEPDIARK